MVKEGADLNAKDCYGNTALHYACAGLNVPCVQYLTYLTGINQDEKNDQGKTAYQVSSEIIFDAVKTFKADCEPYTYSEFIHQLFDKEPELTLKIIKQRFPDGADQTEQNILKLAYDVFYYPVKEGKISSIAKLFAIVLRLCREKAVQCENSLTLTARGSSGATVSDNEQELRTVILGFCCFIACDRSSLKTLSYLAGRSDTSVFFLRQVYFNLKDPNGSKERYFMPLAAIAVGSREIKTIRYLRKLGADFELKYGEFNENVLMTAVKITARNEIIKEIVVSYPKLITEKDKDDNNILHYLFNKTYEYKYDCMIMEIVSDYPYLLSEKNKFGLVPVQMTVRQLNEQTTENISQKLHYAVKNYHCDKKIYFARLMIKYDKSLFASGHAGSANSADYVTVSRYSELVDRIVEISSADPVPEQNRDVQRNGLLKLFYSGFSASERVLFAGYLASEPYPSEIYQLLKKSNSKLKGIINDVLKTGNDSAVLTSDSSDERYEESVC